MRASCTENDGEPGQRPFGTNSGSALRAHARVFRQRAPSRRGMRLSWLRLTSMPISCAASARASRVQ